MSAQSKRLISSCLSIAGVIFILAMAFHQMPGNRAIFAGVVCFVLSGLIWTLPAEADK